MGTGAKHKLFVYGSLANRDYFQIITGKDLPRRSATLPGFQRVTTSRAFPYIVPCPGASAEGVLVESVDRETLAHIDSYEDNGRLYTRRPVLVIAGDEQAVAYAYVGNPDAIEAHFGRDLDQVDRVEKHVDEEIDIALARRVRAEADGCTGLAVRARRELMGDTIEALRRAHFQNPSSSPYIVRYSLERAALPSLDWLRRDVEAQKYAGNYLRLIARTVVFNQFEERVRTQFRSAVRVRDPYHHHTLSTLVSLLLLNGRADSLDAGLRCAGLDTYRPDRDYLDYIREALVLADALYDPEAAAEAVGHVEASRQEGGTPMGAETEFSYAGARAVTIEPGGEPHFDSFYYFHDFDLARRLWKLGGYVDDHTGVFFDESRSRGFLELAFGRLRVGGDLSRPATNDTWVLSELIRQAACFIEVPPHSLHVSLQAQADRPFTRLENPHFLVCLLVLGGDLRPDHRGVLREMRIYGREIINKHTGLEFSRLNSHRAEESDAQPTPVVEFTFARLSLDQSYEPLILALKGFQWATNPMPLDYSDRCPYRAYHREIERELKGWARHPLPLTDAEIGTFVAEVERGLEAERRERGGHTLTHMRQGLAAIEERLRSRNALIREYAGRSARVRETAQKNA